MLAFRHLIISHDKALLGAWKLQKGSYFFQEPENAKKANILAAEIAKMVDRFFMQFLGW